MSYEPPEFPVPAFPTDDAAPKPDLLKIAEHLRGISAVLRRTRRGFAELSNHLDKIATDLEGFAEVTALVEAQHELQGL